MKFWPLIAIACLTVAPAALAQTPSEQVFCGNSIKSSPTQVCQSFAVYPNTQALENAEIRGWVVSSGQPRSDGVDDNGEGEFEFNLLLDIGWNPTPGITPVNSLAAIGTWLTPFNIISWGVKSPIYRLGPGGTAITGTPADALPPGVGIKDMDGQPKVSELGMKGKFGGVGSGVIHIEVDGWAAGRACAKLPLSPDGWPFHDAYHESTNPTQTCSNSHFISGVGSPIFIPATFWDNHGRIAPAGWTYTTPDDDNTAFSVYWPFSLPTLQNGQYVRLVGTIWRDSYHGPSNIVYPPKGYDDMGQAQSCWQGDDDYTNNGGHLEMHPVSIIQAATPPAPKDIHLVGAYQICDKNGDLVQLTDSYSMPVPPPYANSVLQVNEFVRGEFTNWTSLRPSSSTPRFATTSNTTTNITVQSQDGNPPAKFMGLYESYYSCAPTCTGRCAAADNGCGGTCGSDQCPVNFACTPGSTGSCVRVCTPSCGTSCGGTGDGCGGICPTVTCPASFTCSAGSCVCPAGTTNCGGVCVNTNTSDGNCGFCGNSCTFGVHCANAQCGVNGSGCGAGTVSCCGGDICAKTCPKQCP